MKEHDIAADGVEVDFDAAPGLGSDGAHFEPSKWF